VSGEHDELRVRLAELAEGERELRRLLTDTHAQVAARDEEIRRLLDELARERAERDRVMGEAAAAHAELAALRSTRVMRTARLWWRLRHALRSR
jgi:hypothetical protein